jgi:hypothetical protein
MKKQFPDVEFADSFLMSRYYNNLCQLQACSILSNVLEERVYSAKPGAKTYSLVPAMGGEKVNEGMCSVAFGRVDQAGLAFFGDVNCETPSVEIATLIITGILGITQTYSTFCKISVIGFGIYIY